MSDHVYRSSLSWDGSTGQQDYDRTHDLRIGPASLRVSADAAFRGDPDLPNPEQMLVAAASSCQLLSFLAVAASAGVEVLKYHDAAEGLMPESGRPVRITRIVLRPTIVVRGSSADQVERLLHQAHRRCYIANSLNSEVVVEPTIEVG